MPDGIPAHEGPPAGPVRDVAMPLSAKFTVAQLMARFGPEMLAHSRVSDEVARAYARSLASAGRENFAVLSRFVPRELKDDFAAIYAFCRWADDLSDEMGVGPEARPRALAMLNWWQGHLNDCYAGREPSHPVFQVLQPVVTRRSIPKTLFDNLLIAFSQDQQIVRYDSLQQVLGYCTNSADPVGRIILHLGNNAGDPSLVQMSDSVCTGLQLINLWQDVRRDYDKLDRIYLPLRELGLSESQLQTWMNDRAKHAEQYAEALGPLVDDAQRRLEAGLELPRLVHPSIAKPIWLFVHGGLEVVAAVRKRGYATLWHRPRVSKWRRMVLLAKVMLKA